MTSDFARENRQEKCFPFYYKYFSSQISRKSFLHSSIPKSFIFIASHQIRQRKTNFHLYFFTRKYILIKIISPRTCFPRTKHPSFMGDKNNQTYIENYNYVLYHIFNYKKIGNRTQFFFCFGL